MKKKITLTSIKYLLLLIITIVAGIHSEQLLIIPASVFELFFVFYISNRILKKYTVIGYLVNLILSLLFLLQQSIFFFSGEYLSELMVDNLNMVGNLGDMLPWYITSACCIFIIALLPCRYVSIPLIGRKIVFVCVAFYLCMLVVMSKWTYQLYSPYIMLAKTTKNIVLTTINRYRYRISDEDRERFILEFHKDSIRRSIVVIDRNIPKNPNVIVLFAEGISMEVLDVSNDMGLELTPNLDQLYQKSLVFANYYNHTAATFAGLKGQLYSGFFYPNGVNEPKKIEESKYFKFVSLIDILKANGYSTSFINVESQTPFIVDYFDSFHFDSIYSKKVDYSLSDKEAFQLLESAIEEAESPYCIAMYNLGTHHGFDSPDVKYKDGKNPLLNRYHNYDAQLGVFLNSLQNKNLLDNTILIVTTDHASYYSPEFKKIFKNSSGLFIDRVPLIFYWNGVEHEVIDVDGRNSVDFTPTVMDMLDVNGENYFLGTSLFLKEKNHYNTMSTVLKYFYYTGNNKVEPVESGYLDNIWSIRKFHSISDEN